MLGAVDGAHAAGAEGGDDPVARVVVQLLGEAGEGRRVGEVRRWSAGREGGGDTGPRTNDDGTWKPDGGSTADSPPSPAPRPSRRCGRGASRPASLPAGPGSTGNTSRRRTGVARSRPSPGRRAGPEHRPTVGRQEGGWPRYPVIAWTPWVGRGGTFDQFGPTMARRPAVPLVRDYQRECRTGANPFK